ncbi:hypothetical protein JKG47_20370 [Acidithiobacillus sp. MC6.1]|nr:hypothetical protein [Acidithiobacillus sp. MC6.1]
MQRNLANSGGRNTPQLAAGIFIFKAAERDAVSCEFYDFDSKESAMAEVVLLGVWVLGS